MNESHMLTFEIVSDCEEIEIHGDEKGLKNLIFYLQRLLDSKKSAPNHDHLMTPAEFCRAHGYNPEVVHLSVSPEVGLLSCVADWDADLLVIGKSVDSWIRRRLFGKAVKVIRNADRPLFLC